MTGKLKEKTVLVTGASSGLGLADVMEFVKEEADIIIMVRSDSERLVEAATKVKTYGKTEIITYPLDVTSENE